MGPTLPDDGWKQAAWNWAWERRDEIAASLARIYLWFRGNRSGTKEASRSILLVGAGGTGKTTLGRLLVGTPSSREYTFLLDVPSAYDESIEVETYTRPDSREVEVIIPPGQEHLRATYWPELCAGIAGGKFRGVILLNSHGYHSLGQIRYKQHELFKTTKKQFLQDYLADRRTDERKVLRELVPHLKATREKMWFLSLVTKQDLWWKDCAEVEKCYRQGEYGELLRAVQAHRGTQLFRHEFVFASLVIQNFTTAHGEELAKNTAGYDHGRQVESLRRLFETVDSLRGWEEEP